MTIKYTKRLLFLVLATLFSSHAFIATTSADNRADNRPENGADNNGAKVERMIQLSEWPNANLPIAFSDVFADIDGMPIRKQELRQNMH